MQDRYPRMAGASKNGRFQLRFTPAETTDEGGAEEKAANSQEDAAFGQAGPSGAAAGSGSQESTATVAYDAAFAALVTIVDVLRGGVKYSWNSLAARPERIVFEVARNSSEEVAAAEASLGKMKSEIARLGHEFPYSVAVPPELAF